MSGLSAVSGLSGLSALCGDVEGDPITASDETVVVGTVISGTPGNSRDCADDASWVIEETDDGINVVFTFYFAQGSGKKVRTKGRWEGDSTDLLSVQAWNGSDWDTVGFMPVSDIDNYYYANLAEEYTIDGILQVRVYQAAGGGDKNKLYLDCIVVFTTGSPSPDPLALIDDDSDPLVDEDSVYLVDDTG